MNDFIDNPLKNPVLHGIEIDLSFLLTNKSRPDKHLHYR